MVLGIGCIFWAMFSIFGQSNYFAKETSNSYDAPTYIVAKNNNVASGVTSRLN